MLDDGNEQAGHPVALFRAVFDAALDAMLLVGDDGCFVDANSAACGLFGTTRDELLGSRARDFADPDLSNPWGTGPAADGLTGPFALRRPDGATRDVECATTRGIVPGLHLSVLRDVTERNLAQREERRVAAALHESEQRYRVLVERSPEPTLVHVDGRVVFANQAAAHALGLPRADDLLGRSVLEFAAPESHDLLVDRMARGMDLRDPDVVTQRFVRADDGRIVSYEVASNPIVYGGRPALLTMARDVSRTEQAARERERLIASLEFERGRLGTLLQKTPAFMAVLRGPEHICDLTNDAFFALVGPQDLLGRPIREGLPQLAAQYGEILDGVLRTGEPFVVTAAPVVVSPRRGAEPVERLVSAMFQAVVEADGTRSGVFVHGVDVTADTLAQRRIRAQFNGIPMPTYVWQRVVRQGVRDAVLVDFNDAAVKSSRGTVAAALGMSTVEFFEDDAGMIADVERCLDTGETFQREMDRTVRGTTEPRRLLVTYASGPPDLALAHTEDVTDRRKLEEQFRQAQKMEAVGRLAGGIAHDFNNLLSVILSYSAFIIEDLSPADPMRADLEEVRRAGERAVELTQQLLAFSRQQVLQPRRMNLNQVLADVQKMLHRVLGEDIELSLVPAREVAEVFADPSQIEQVIMNLIVNARDAMPKGGRLTIETQNVEFAGVVRDGVVEHSPGPYVLMAVTDTGVGMDEATRARVFEPFFTTKGVGQGTGLGLSTVFGIVHQSGGEVVVDSEPGRGTTFRVYLPRATAQLSIAPPPMPRAAARGGAETILLVEDEDAVRVIARTILRRAGYHVLEAQNGGEAFLICEEFGEHIDLLITDVVMPRMSGRQLAERLLVARPDLKVLYMSGYTGDVVVHHGVLEARVAFLQKPITPEPLLRAAREVLDAALTR